jgi:hypothetical protein
LGKLVFLQAQALLASSSFIPFPQYAFLIHKRLLHSLALGYAREYSQVTRIQAPFFLTSTSFDTTLTLTTLHPKLDGYFLTFLEDY